MNTPEKKQIKLVSPLNKRLAIISEKKHSTHLLVADFTARIEVGSSGDVLDSVTLTEDFKAFPRSVRASAPSSTSILLVTAWVVAVAIHRFRSVTDSHVIMKVVDFRVA